MGGRRGLPHRPPGHLADAESHEERRPLGDGAQTESRGGKTGLTVVREKDCDQHDRWLAFTEK